MTLNDDLNFVALAIGAFLVRNAIVLVGVGIVALMAFTRP
jgi:hypothetical protein